MAASSSSISGFHFHAPTNYKKRDDPETAKQVDEVQEHGGPPHKAKENRKQSKLMIALGGKGGKKGLTKAQEARLRKHAKDHSQEHMEFMRVELEAGKTFKQAHAAAMERYGR